MAVNTDPPASAADEHEVLQRAHTLGVQAWPALAVDRATFANFVRQRIAAEIPEHELAGHLDSLCLDDLYLACACAERLPGAAEAFEARCGSAIRAAIAPIARGDSWADEVAQLVREIVLLGVGRRGPAIADYSGRGALRAWVRIIAVREALRARRSGKGEVAIDDDAILDVLAPSHDPELSYIKSHAAQAFRRAFLAAVAALPRRERAVLRLHILDGLSIDRIAP
ncbi:MAG: hypothetical protein AAGC55_26925, partial [Myxococcota bacterium]